MGKKKKTLLLQPIRGKFVQSNINGKIVRVWLVDPDTNQQGTEIPYADAIAVLALPHPVVCMAQIKDKTGKYCNLLDDDDKEILQQKRDEYFYGVQNVVSETPSLSDSSSLAQLVETQAELIKSQKKQLEKMQEESKKSQKLMEKLLKEIKDDKKQ